MAQIVLGDSKIFAMKVSHVPGLLLFTANVFHRKYKNFAFSLK